MDYKYHGIILGKIDIAETDRIYVIYTQEAGKIRIMAKGVRRPNAKLAGSLEPLTFAEIFTARGQGSGKITGAIPVENFSAVKADFELLSRILRVFKIVQKTISEEEKDEKFFRLLLEYLEAMEKLAEAEEDRKIQKAEILTLGFLVKFLDQMGYRAEVSCCVGCGMKLKPAGNFFSASRGGILCQNCVTKERNITNASAESIKMIRVFLQNNIKNLVKIQASTKEINNVKIIVKSLMGWGLGINI